MMSDSRVSSVIHEWASSYSGQAHTLNHTTPTNQLASMDMIPYSQAQGLGRGGGEDMMGLSYLPYTSSCLSNNSSSGSTLHHQSQANTQQDFSSFLLPTLRAPGVNKRSISKDSAEYRMRRERNNVAVRKSRDKARRRIMLTQQRALQLQDENQKLQMRIGQLTQELVSLKHILSQRHLPGAEEGAAGVSAI